MATIVGNPDQTFNDLGLPDSQKFEINSILLFVGDSSSIELKTPGTFEELVVNEDIFSPAATGYILITDTLGLIENININGFCKLAVKFSKAGSNDPNAFSRIFRIYKIGERFQISRAKEKYAMYFCSEELIMSEQMKVAKSYPNTQIHQIMYDVLFNRMKTPLTKVGTFEDTLGYYCFIIPNLKPFEAFSWLSTYAQPTSQSSVGADMLFYENRNGFNFRSLQSIMKTPVYNTYNYSPKNIGASTRTNISGIIAYKFVNTFDSLRMIGAGGYANKLISLDPILRQVITTPFNYNNYKGNKLNNFGTLSSSQNRLGKNAGEMSDSVVKVATGNKNQLNSLSIANVPNGQSTVVQDIGIEKYVPNRTAQLALINQIKIQFSVPGDPGLSIGRVITLNIPSYAYNGNPNSSNLDKYFTGNYLVSAVKHVMNKEGIYQCMVEAISDSTSTQQVSGSINDSLSQYLNNQ